MGFVDIILHVPYYSLLRNVYRSLASPVVGAVASHVSICFSTPMMTYGMRCCSTIVSRKRLRDYLLRRPVICILFEFGLRS